jgi:ABC-type bacteriocin/lantibiotic exporter with double-glycine peptidase domain
MRFFKSFIILVLSLFFLAGCATQTPQVERLLSATSQMPRAFEIPAVPYVAQSAGHCGPATLSMVASWAHHDVPLEQLIQQVYTPGMEGSLQTDMISAARRQGLMAVPLQGFTNLLTEVSAGHPVIVFENLALSWMPQWHYAVVYGYDLDKQTVLMHSGPEKGKVWDIRKFERSWRLGDYWGLVVLPSSQLAATATELGLVKSAASLEQMGFLEQAEDAYETILNKWPQSLAALIGAGNIQYAKKDYRASEKYLLLATKFHPESAAARHNLEVARQALK